MALYELTKLVGYSDKYAKVSEDLLSVETEVSLEIYDFFFNL